MRVISFLTLVLATSLAGLSSAGATEPPPESISKLQHVFRNVADGLFAASEDAWHVGRHDVCIELHRLTVEMDPTSIESYSVGAWLIWSAGRDAEAIAMYRKGIAANPNDYRLHFDLGMHYYRTKRYLDAEKSFVDAVSISSLSPVWKMLAHSRERQGRFEEALAAWEKVKEVDPTDPVIDQNIRRIEEHILSSATPLSGD